MNKNFVKISVIMPVLNRAGSFRQAIESVLKFKEKEYDIEIIVIDGGSSDGTLDVIREFIDQISYWETGLDNGICNAFNRGIHKAAGNLIAILNSDDYWTEDGLPALVKTVSQNPGADIYHSSIRYIDDNNKYTYVLYPNVKRLKRRMSVFHPTMFVKKKCYEKIGLYDESYQYAMDSDWCLRAFKKGARFCEVPTVLVNMRLDGVSDVNYVNSLREYRDSVIRNKVAGLIFAYFFYIHYTSFKRLMRYKIFNNIKRIKHKCHYFANRKSGEFD